MRNLLIIIVIVIILGALGALIFYGSKDYKSKSSNTTTTTSTTNTTTNTKNISIKNLSFDPSETTVKVGTIITWTNNDSVTHTIASEDNSFSSRDIAPGGTYKFTFDTAGTFTYHCTIHPFMTGKVIVQ